MLQANTGVRATLVDLADTVARGREFLAERGLDGRCEFAGQSFFDPLPADGDVYLLSAVLHDWDDEAAIAILRRCAQAAGDAGHVVIVESHGTGGDDPGMFAEMVRCVSDAISQPCLHAVRSRGCRSASLAESSASGP